MLTDFHSHILPGVDDGSADPEQSLEMLRMEAEQGVCRVVATPHFYPRHDDPVRFLQRRARGAEKLAERIAGESGLPELILGAEVHYYPGMSESNVLSQLTIGNGTCIMIEMPGAPWTEKMFRELELIYEKQGLIPVIAHIDRYIGPWNAGRIFRRLAQSPVLIQANGAFFTRRATAGLALRLLREGKIHVLGSDCHNCFDRPPDLGKAMKVIFSKIGETYLEQIRNDESKILQR